MFFNYVTIKLGVNIYVFELYWCLLIINVSLHIRKGNYKRTQITHVTLLTCLLYAFYGITLNPVCPDNVLIRVPILSEPFLGWVMRIIITIRKGILSSVSALRISSRDSNVII